MVFVASADGTVRALDAAEGKLRWKAYTGGAVHFSPALWKGRLYTGSFDGYVYAHEAATGRLLWRFRAAPAGRRIPVFGRLISTWPVAGGVVVKDGTVYAAAGIAHYDSTHVYALDAVTGKVKWYNDKSGQLSDKTNCGISLQGNLHLSGDRLCFPGGNAYGMAQYDVRTGKCLNAPRHAPSGITLTAFDYYYPAYSSDVARMPLAGGKRVEHRGGALGLYGGPPPKGRRPPRPKPLWQNRSVGQAPRSFVAAPNGLLVAGRDGPKSGTLAAVNLEDGSCSWTQKLPARPVKWGAATDSKGRILVSLEDGRVLCFAAK
jgi:outer membrane protein assembly factor BamB